MALNNNDDPNFEHRLLIAFALSVLLFLVVLPYLSRKTTPAPAPAKPAATAPAAAAPAAPGGAPAAAPPGRAAAAVKAAPALAVVAAPTPQTLTLDTPVFHIVFSNRGATAQAWILTRYKDDNGKPLDVVDPTFAAKFGYPLAFYPSDADLRQQLGDALFQMAKTTAANGDQTVTFTWSNGTLQASKRITFNQGYVAELQTSLTRDGQPVPAPVAWQGAFGDRAVPGDFNAELYFQQSGGGADTFAAKNVTNAAVRQGQYQFVGVEDQYFAAAFLPNGDNPLAVTTLKSQYQPRLVDAAGNVTTNSPVQTLGLAVSNGSSNDTRLFVGPKQRDLLKSIDPAMADLVNYGWFTFLAEPLFLWLHWTYVHWIHNYGWSILFLTLVLNLATFPLKMRAQKSQAKMMALQPKVNAINAKMKKYGMRDPRRQEVQQELMKLYSEHGVNPLGGCLPMLIQLPVLYTFWRVLDGAIELRHAPWIGYIHDLSAKDPYFVLPLLVVLSTFMTSALMPTVPGQDPRQAKMMKWMMPVMMGWLFFYLPAGVNLYYLGANLIGSGQQWVANHTYNAAAVAAVAAKDKAKDGKKVIDGKIVGSPKR
ncbi:MAG TPA: membrane protein insertase YidC [Terriglobales bacterium]|nr:membrane protein insertase YidC [Terriglobales bacterium]